MLRDFTLYDVLARNAQAYGERLAVVTELGEEWTFAELMSRVDRLGSGLARAGLEPGDRICVLALNSASYLELYLASARQGFVVYPINWRLTADEVARIVERAAPRAFVSDSACRSSVPSPEAASTVDLWIDLGDGDGDGDGEQKSLGDFRAEMAPAPEVDAGSALAVIATAAVDVIPRGALLSHTNLVTANLQEIAAYSLTPEDRNLVALPLFHIAGLGHCLSFLHAGGANVVAPKFDPVQAVELIDRHQISHISSFPPVLASVLEAAEKSASKLSSLRLVSGLDSPETMQRLHDQTKATFMTGFGQCETSGFVTLQDARERLGCAGKAAELCRVELVDDYDRPVAAGQEGEIVVRGPLVFLGYDGLNEVTEYTFRNGWHHTGDVGRFDDEGNLYYVRRKAEKELIKPGGENVYPAEVESVIVELDEIEQACVYGVPDPKWGEAIRAVVELSPGAEITAERVIEHVGSRIARFKRPRDVEVVRELPRDDQGEIDREAVKERWR